jgi:hypothetical protein
MKRFDFTDLEIGKNVKKTKQGFLVIDAFTARTGIQEYIMPDGSILKEYRSDEEVFSESSMSSLRTAVLTDGHPKDMVSPDNAKELMKGFPNGFIEKVKDGDESFLRTQIVVTHRDAISAIEAGKVQLSNGYNVDLDFTQGEYKGKKYDALQKNIVNNHIALVWKGRAGEKAKLRLDSEDAILNNNAAEHVSRLDNENDSNKENQKMKLKIGEKEFDVADEVGNAVKEEIKKLTGVKTDNEDKIGELGTEIEILKASKEKLIAKADALESDLEKAKKEKMDESEIAEKVKERISVLDSGNKILDKETISKMDEMSNIEIKKAIVKADSPDVSEEKLKQEIYVDARYDHICENFSNSDEKKMIVGKEIIKNRNDKKDEYKSPEQIRLDNMKKDKEASLATKA